MSGGSRRIATRGIPLNFNIRNTSDFRVKKRKGLKPFSEAELARFRRSAKQSLALARKQILSFYKRGWPGFTEKEKASRTSIARALVAKGIVTAFKTDTRIIPLLESLQKSRKIRLPAKTNRGGLRQKKK